MKQIPGMVIGIVKDLEDPEKQGRIRLEFPWMGSVRSSWAPIAAPLAGKQRGMYYMPEIDDEALVAFEQGDFDHPYVIGFLWNGVDVPPESDYHNRVLVTPGGHTLRFEDTDKAKKIILKSSSGHTLQFDDTDNAKKIILKSSSGHTITLDDSSAGQTVTVQTASKQTLVLDDKDSSIELRGGGRSLAMRGGLVQIT